MLDIKIGKLKFLWLPSLRLTWCLNKRGGPITIIPPEGIRKIRDIWSGKIKICDLQESLLVRNVEVEPCGKLSEPTCKIASKLRYPHHQGA
jgi:hypothetical protein